MCLLAPGHLLGRKSERGLVLLPTSPDAGAGTVEGSGEEVFFFLGLGGGSDAWVNHHKRK